MGVRGAGRRCSAHRADEQQRRRFLSLAAARPVSSSRSVSHTPPLRAVCSVTAGHLTRCGRVRNCSRLRLPFTKPRGAEGQLGGSPRRGRPTPASPGIPQGTRPRFCNKLPFKLEGGRGFWATKRPKDQTGRSKLA